MKKQRINITALFLAILIFVSFGTKEMHHFLIHAHEEMKICDAQKGEKHLHDEEYIHHDCSLCDFTFSLFELPAFIIPALDNTITHIETEFSFRSIFCVRTHFFKPLRGPPHISAKSLNS